MGLTLRVPTDTPLTNQELDDNFKYLDGKINLLNSFTGNIETALVSSVENLEALLDTKQDKNAKLTSLSLDKNPGFLSINGNTIQSRTFITNNINNIVINNGNGVTATSVIFDIGQDVLTLNSVHTVTNKSLSGLTNTFTNLSLTTAVIGILPIANGGTNASDIINARSNLNVLIKPESNGIVTKIDEDASVVRQIIVSGVGLSITNGSGVLGNPTISSNATATNTPNTIVSRDANGNFNANDININSIRLENIGTTFPELRFSGNAFATSDDMFRLVFDGNNNGNGRFVIGKSFTNPSQYTENTVNEVFSINNNGAIEAKTTNYETLITANNIITNKKYVDDKHNSTVQAVNAVQATVTNFINNSVVPRAAIMFTGSGSVIRSINCTVIRTDRGRYRLFLDPSVINNKLPIAVLGESSVAVGNSLTGGFIYNYATNFVDIGIDSRWAYNAGNRHDNIQVVAGQQSADTPYPIGVTVF